MAVFYYLRKVFNVICKQVNKKPTNSICQGFVGLKKFKSLPLVTFGAVFVLFSRIVITVIITIFTLTVPSHTWLLITFQTFFFKTLKCQRSFLNLNSNPLFITWVLPFVPLFHCQLIPLCYLIPLCCSKKLFASNPTALNVDLSKRKKL